MTTTNNKTPDLNKDDVSSQNKTSNNHVDPVKSTPDKPDQLKPENKPSKVPSIASKPTTPEPSTTASSQNTGSPLASSNSGIGITNTVNIPALEESFPDCQITNTSDTMATSSSTIISSCLDFLTFFASAFGPIGSAVAGVFSAINSNYSNSQQTPLSSLTTIVNTLMTQNQINEDYSKFQAAFQAYSAYFQTFNLTTTSAIPQTQEFAKFFDELETDITDPSTSDLIPALTSLENLGSQGLSSFIGAFTIYLYLYQYYLTLLWLKANDDPSNESLSVDYATALSEANNFLPQYQAKIVTQFNSIIDTINSRLDQISLAQSGTEFLEEPSFGDMPSTPIYNQGYYFTDSANSSGLNVLSGLPPDTVNFVAGTDTTALNQANSERTVYYVQQLQSLQNTNYFTNSHTMKKSIEAINSILTTNSTLFTNIPQSIRNQI